MKLSIKDAEIRRDALTAQASALTAAIDKAKAAGQTEIDTDQALLDLDTQLASQAQNAIDRLPE